MRKFKLLSIDETGKASYNHPSELFTISGIVMPEDLKPKIDTVLRKLKKKYFKNEEIVFHNRDMVRRKGPFHIFQELMIETAFWSEYLSTLDNENISAYFILTNKKNAMKKNWRQKTILKRSYLKILEVFAESLRSGYQGKIILESDPMQDFFLIQAHNRIQSIGTSNNKLQPGEYRNRITSISLVNKSNLDTDVQIADTLAPAAALIYEIKIAKSIQRVNAVDKMKIHLIEKKLKNKSNKSVFEVLV